MLNGFRLTLGVLLLAAPAPLAAGVLGSKYQSAGRCGPYWRAAVKTPAWLCLGIVAGPEQGLVFPRQMLEIGPGRFLLTDMGAWVPGRGRLLALAVDGKGGVAIETLADRLDIPHGLARGPDGKAYVGERTRIWRFDPAKGVNSAETVVDRLPGEGLHRLKHIVFDRDGSLIVNVGSNTDRCEKDSGRDPTVRFPCPEIDGDRPNAALWRIKLAWPEGKVVGQEVIARGLRNSMALAVSPSSGALLQAENSIDLEPEDEPPEEINVVIAGKHYGWPYCTGDGTRVPDFKSRKIDCDAYEKPLLLVPGHAAPLGLLYYRGSLFPELAGTLLMSAHGFRANGHRIVAYKTGKDGLPIAPAGKGVNFPETIVGGWTSEPGVMPQGAPVGLTEAADGSLWFAEDRNKTVMVLLRSGSDASVPAGKVKRDAVVAMPPGYEALHVALRPACKQCHVEFAAKSATVAFARVAGKGWADGGDRGAWLLVRAMQGKGVRRAMPPPRGLASRADLAKSLATFLAAKH